MLAGKVRRIVAWLPTPGRNTDPSGGDDDHVSDVNDEIDDVDVEAGNDAVDGENRGVDGQYGEGSDVDVKVVKVDPDAVGGHDEAARDAEPSSEPWRPEAEALVPSYRFAGADRDARPRPHRNRGCVERAQKHRENGGEIDA